MERDELERLLSKELDGELTPEEAAALKAAIETDPDAARLAESWRRTEAALRKHISTLGEPSADVRARVRRKARPSPRREKPDLPDA